MTQNKKSKKGISPVIASIILIAVTIAIAIAVAGWIFGLFGTYTAGPALQVRNASFVASSGVLNVAVYNQGASAIAPNSVSAGGVTMGTPTSSPSPITGNTAGTITSTRSGGSTVTAGTSYTFNIRMNDGSSIVVVVTAS